MTDIKHAFRDLSHCRDRAAARPPPRRTGDRRRIFRRCDRAGFAVDDARLHRSRADWPALLREAIDSATTADLVGTSLPAGNVTLLAPIPRPRKNIFGIGLNYTEHVAESARSLDTSKDLPQQPVIFSKPPTAVVAWNDPIRHNAKVTQQLDRSEEHTSELQSLMRISYAVFCLKKKRTHLPNKTQ